MKKSSKSSVRNEYAYVTSAPLDRQMRLVEIIGKSSRPVTLSEAIASTQESKTTVDRDLRALATVGLLHRNQSTPSYEIGPRLRELVLQLYPMLHASQRTQSILQRVRDATGETCDIGSLHGNEVKPLAIAPTRHTLRTTFGMVDSVPAYCSAVGKCLLAHLTENECAAVLDAARLEKRAPNTKTTRDEIMKELKQVRRQGYAIAIDELEEGVSAIAVPVNDRWNRPSLSICVHGPTVRLPRTALLKYRELLEEAAKDLSGLEPPQPAAGS